MQTFILAISVFLASMFGGLFVQHESAPVSDPVAVGAPGQRYERTILPETTEIYDLGTTTKAWSMVYTKDLTITGTCTGCGTGGGGGSGGTWSTTTSTVAGRLVNYPNNSATDIVAIGSNSTTTAEYWFDPNTSTSKITGAITLPSFTSGSLAVNASGGIYKAATTTYSSGLTYLNGNVTADLGTSVDLTSEVSGDLPFSSLAQVSANSLLGNNTGATADARSIATSSLGLLVGSFLSPNISQWTNDASYETGLTAGDGLTRTVNDFDCDTASGSVFGCLTSTDWNTFNGKSGFSYPFPNSATTSSLSLGGLSFTSGTGTSVYASASSTFQVLNAGTLTIPSLTSALLLTNGSGVLAEYTGNTCTNQFARSDSALGTWTCATVGTADVASGIALDTELPIGANPTGTIGLTAVNGVATTFLRSDGAPALSQSIIPTWTGLHTFNTGGLISTASSTIQNFNSASSTLGTLLITGNATGTNAHFSTSIFSALANLTKAIFTNATSTTLFSTQAMFTTASSTAFTATTFNLPQYKSSSVAVNSSGAVYAASTSTPSTFTFATSSLNVNSTTTISMAGFYGGATITQFGCTGVGGTFTSVIGDGTASSTYVVSSNSLTTTYTALSSNNSFTSGEKIFWAIGPASAAGLQSPSCSWLRN